MHNISALLNNSSKEAFPASITQKMALKLLALSPHIRRSNPSYVDAIVDVINSSNWDGLSEEKRTITLRRKTGEILDGGMRLRAISQANKTETRILVVLIDEDVIQSKA